LGLDPAHEHADAPALLSNRALVLLKLRRFDECVADCDAVLARDTGHVKALYRRSQARDSMGDAAGALADLSVLLTHDPQNREAKAGKAELLMRTAGGASGVESGAEGGDEACGELDALFSARVDSWTSELSPDPQSRELCVNMIEPARRVASMHHAGTSSQVPKPAVERGLRRVGWRGAHATRDALPRRVLAADGSSARPLRDGVRLHALHASARRRRQGPVGRGAATVGHAVRS
jgi:hypothetical protein